MKKFLFFALLMLLSSVNVLLPLDYSPDFPTRDQTEWLPVESLDESSKLKLSKDEDEIDEDEIKWLPVESLDESSKLKLSKDEDEIIDEDEIKWLSVESLDEILSKDEIGDLYVTLIKIKEAFSGLNKAFSELKLSESNEKLFELNEDFSELNKEFDKTLGILVSGYNSKKS